MFCFNWKKKNEKPEDMLADSLLARAQYVQQQVIEKPSFKR